MVAKTRRELQHMLNVLDQACSRWGMTISTGKSKILSVGVQLEHQPHITLQGQVLEDVESSYLGSELGQTEKVERGVAVRLEKASKVYQIWRQKVFKNRNLSRPTKVHVLYHGDVCLLYAETWPVT